MPDEPTARTPDHGRPLQAALLLCGLLACGDARHTVGQVRAPNTASTASRPASATAGETGMATPPRAGSQSSGRSGAAGQGIAGADAPDAMPSGAGSGASVCLPSSVPAQRKRLDLYLMVDINFTLPLTNSWTMLTGGLIEYVGDQRAQGTGVGIDFFGVLPPVTNIDCSPTFYSMPTVGVGMLPGNTTAIESSVRRALPLQGSPLQPALQGALAYSRSRANFYRLEADQAVVLVTDGLIDWACGTDVGEVSDVAARSAPVVPTYVVAIEMPNDVFDQLVSFEPLDAIAREGTTGAARRVARGASASAVRDALLEIQRDAEPCDYFVPGQVAAGATLNLATSATPQVPLARLASESDCGDGYYPGVGDEANLITLCPATCDSVKQRGQSLTWTIECATP